MQRKYYIWLGFVILFAAIIVAATPFFIKARRKAMEYKIRENISHIGYALTSYSQAHDWMLPKNISSLIDEGYFRAFPKNPYTGKPMKNVELGSPQAGEFTYVLFLSDYTGQHDWVWSFYLIGYGDENCRDLEFTREYGFRQVIIINGSGDSFTSGAPKWDDAFLKGADTPTLLDKWKKPGQGGPESTDNGE